MIFVTADTHFFHKNILSYCGRPYFSVEEMNMALIDNWNKTVSPNDDVYHLGDFGFANTSNLVNILKNLNGRKFLICGNHDKINSTELKGTNKFIEVYQYHELRVFEKTIILNHYAQRTWNKAYHGSWHLFGHSHGNLEPFGNSVDVGVDSPYITGKKEYRPFSFDEINTFFNTKNSKVSNE